MKRSPPEPQEERLLASYPADLSSVTRVTEYRSTWIAASRDLLLSLGLFDRYESALRRIDRERCPGAEEAILSAVANAWLSMPVVRAHYDACQTLGLSESEVLANALSEEGGQVRRAWHAQLIAAAQKPGVTSFTMLSQVPKWWARYANGGGMAVYQQGPQQARMEYRACELFEVPYYIHAVRATLVSFASRFCKELTVKSAAQPSAEVFSFVLRWR
jgi:hypothetical protein